MSRRAVRCYPGLPLLLVLLVGLAPVSLRAQTPGSRLALVIGEAAYRDAPLKTAANDAALVAATLEAAGFEVIGGADLGRAALQRAVRDFVAKVRRARPEATVFVYLAGRGVQYEGENFLAPIDATIARDTDVPIEALRLGDLVGALVGPPLRARIIVLDGARANGFARSGAPLAGGLALVAPPPGTLVALNAAPGTIAPEEPGPYGVYATALAEMLGDGGVPLQTSFERIRLRVNADTGGRVVPWDAAALAGPLVLLRGAPQMSAPSPTSQPLRDLPAANAYAVTIARDTLASYREFLAAFPRDPLTARVSVLRAARLEALTWAQSVAANRPEAFWTYMRRYPRGPHIGDARRLLGRLGAPLEPPPRFDVFVYDDLPSPPDSDYEIVDRPFLTFQVGGPTLPPPPATLLPARNPAVPPLPPPAPAPEPGFLPILPPIPVPRGRPPDGPGRLEQPNFGQQRPAGAPSAGPPRGAPRAGPAPGAKSSPSPTRPPTPLPPIPPPRPALPPGRPGPQHS